MIGDHVYKTDYAGIDPDKAGCQHAFTDDSLCGYPPDKHMYRPSTARREFVKVEPRDDKLPHLDPCVCTIDGMTGKILDYDCGRDLDLATVGKKAPRSESNELLHLNTCVCTISLRTGEIKDYDCGRQIARQKNDSSHGA